MGAGACGRNRVQGKGSAGIHARTALCKHPPLPPHASSAFPHFLRPSPSHTLQLPSPAPHTLMKLRTTSRKRPFHSDQRPPKCGNAPTCNRGRADKCGHKGTVGMCRPATAARIESREWHRAAMASVRLDEAMAIPSLCNYLGPPQHLPHFSPPLPPPHTHTHTLPPKPDSARRSPMLPRSSWSPSVPGPH